MNEIWDYFTQDGVFVLLLLLVVVIFGIYNGIVGYRTRNYNKYLIFMVMLIPTHKIFSSSHNIFHQFFFYLVCFGCLHGIYVLGGKTRVDKNNKETDE